MQRMKRLVCVAWIAVASTTGEPVLAAPSAPSAAAAAKPKTLAETLTGQARTDYEAGRLLIADGDHAGARIKFQAAYDASKDPRLLWNLAVCEKSLRHYAKTIELLKRYSNEGGALVTQKERDDVSDLVKTLEPFTVALAIEVNEPDAEIEVDDVLVGKSPLASRVVVDIGQRRIRVRKEGFREAVVPAPIGGGSEQTVTVKIERELHEGKLAIQAPLGALVVIDGKQLGTGKGTEPLETTLTSGGHTLRVTAPGMRVYEREVVVQDNETRAVEVVLEKEFEPERPKLRVAVGCVDAEPRGTDDGLAVYLDGSPAAASPTGGKKTWDPDRGRNVLEYVEYTVPSGHHHVLVRLPGCEPDEGDVEVTPISGGDLRGALRSSSPFLVRGPAGNPDWGRVALALWMPSTLGEQGGTRVFGEPASMLEGADYRPRGTGVLLQPGLVFRWWTMSLELGHAQGTPEVGGQPANKSPEILAGLSSARVSWTRVGYRVGARFPFHFASIAIGIGAGYDNLSFRRTQPGIAWEDKHTHNAYASSWIMLEAHVLCDWPAHVGVGVDARLPEADTEHARATLTLQFGAAYQPNKICKTERSMPYRLGVGSRPTREARR